MVEECRLRKSLLADTALIARRMAVAAQA